MVRFMLAAAMLAATVFLSACGGGGGGSDNVNATPGTVVPSAPALSAAAQLGDKIFHDQSLSASGQQSCATCHNPALAHADNLTVPLGGPTMTTVGFRNTPSLRYLSFSPSFFFDPEGTPTGGFFRDGRAASFSEQARRPFFGAHEMANASVTELLTRVRSASYVAEFMQVFGSNIFDDETAAFDRVAFALQQYEKEDAEFRPFDSKFDYYLAGKVALTEQELRGLALFNNPSKGNCAACHPSGRQADGSPPLFTDFTYDNLGVPRNDSIPANADVNYFDLGLCGPDRADLSTRSDLCGAFKVPTLRNIALTAPYFHNGKFATLREVIAFYVRRDTNPEEWYPPISSGSGGIDKFNDLPPQYRTNVNTSEAPYNRQLGDQPALTSAEIDDVVAFLQTLTDGYQP